MNTWIPTVHRVIADYGAGLIPYDIRWALNDVEEALGLEETEFPPRVRIDDNGVGTVVEDW